LSQPFFPYAIQRFDLREAVVKTNFEVMFCSHGDHQPQPRPFSHGRHLGVSNPNFVGRHVVAENLMAAMNQKICAKGYMPRDAPKIWQHDRHAPTHGMLDENPSRESAENMRLV